MFEVFSIWLRVVELDILDAESISKTLVDIEALELQGEDIPFMTSVEVETLTLTLKAALWNEVIEKNGHWL